MGAGLYLLEGALTFPAMPPGLLTTLGRCSA